MNRRSFLLSSTVSAVSCARPVSLSLVTAPMLSAAMTHAVVVPLTTQPSAHEALFRLHNWGADPKHHTADDAAATLISLSASWKAAWL